MPAGTTPLQVAATLDTRANAAVEAWVVLRQQPTARQNRELAATLEDIAAMANLGQYYAAKIRGATALARYREGQRPEHQADAVEQLVRAQTFWLEYTARVAARYRNPLWTNRVGIVDWKELDAEVANDIEIARAPLR